MIVCIAEKPSVARDLADILGARTRKDGYFEGNGYQVTWTFGHLCGLLEPHEYTPDWKSWALSLLPMIPQRFGIKVMDNSGIQKQFKVIEGLIANATEVVNCGDAGQEGELIQRWVLQKALCKVPVKRLWISSLTEDAIRQGFKDLKDQKNYQRLYEAGLSRAIGDWLLGMNATRLYTLKFGKNRQVLSIGRVQTPTLALIVNRHLEIENFKPEQYFELKTVYRNTTFSSAKGKFSSEEEGKELLQKIQNADFEVTDISTKKGTESAPRLFDLTSLQVECNKKFAFSADETLKIIQSLYEKKITTYPRVDTTYLSEDIYPKIQGILKGLKDYESLTAVVLSGKIPKTKKVFDDKKVTDHHAIIPTGVHPLNLSADERKMFDLVARRFIANFYPECKISTTTVLGEVAELGFKVTGKQILEPGWRVVFEKSDEQTKLAENGNSQESNNDESETVEEAGTLPLFIKGESGPHEPGLAEKWTSPPRPYTEATLLRAMETAGKLVDNEDLRDAMKENGIGRPSTRAAIIETLFKRDYVRKEKKNLIPTSTGIELIQIIQEDLLKSAELTGLWEKKLRQIEKGSYEAKQFLDELKEMVTQVVLNVKKDNRTIEQLKTASFKQVVADENSEGKICTVCKKGTVIRGNSAYGCTEWRNGCNFRQPFPVNE
ncbi:MAG: DNA topoisomerase 3 [Paludibacter sp.]|nr:DNA topoisomerase 3 [Paludibacter sp.]